MKSRIFLIFCFLFSVLFAEVSPVAAQDTDSTYMRGKAIEILEHGAEVDPSSEFQDDYQEVTVEITNGPEKGNLVYINHGAGMDLLESEKVKNGDELVILKASGPDGEMQYSISDRYRLSALKVLALFFIVVTVICGGWKGFRSLIGLGLSIIVLMFLVVPGIANGGSPLFYTLLGSLGISCASLFIAHGFKARTTIALIGIMLTVVASLLIAVFSTKIAHIFGTGSDDAFSLQFLGTIPNLDLRGLLIGGIIIGTLGVLDDVATSQAAVVEELKNANPNMKRKELFLSGMSVGREHIAALINTLFLAYAGVSLPLFLMFAVNDILPIPIFLNTEFVAEEIVRTVTGSVALMLAVPLTTYIAAWFFGARKY